jgi:hypothetical protein
MPIGRRIPAGGSGSRDVIAVAAAATSHSFWPINRMKNVPGRRSVVTVTPWAPTGTSPELTTGSIPTKVPEPVGRT